MDTQITLERLQLYDALFKTFMRDRLNDVMYSNTSAIWNADATIIPSGKLAVESDTGKIKIGDGIHTFKDLGYINLTPTEINSLVSSSTHVHGNKEILDETTASFTTDLLKKLNGLTDYSLPTASASTLGGVKIGANINNTGGLISVADGTTSNKGVVLLTHGVSSESTTTAATAGSIKIAYDKALSALPLTGGDMQGMIKLFNSPTDDLHAANKGYVDEAIKNKLVASQGMDLKGTLGTGGTIESLPITNIVKGDFYKIITPGDYAGYSDCKIGDILIAQITGNGEADSNTWLYIPSGNETETYLKWAASGVNLGISAKSGTIVLGEAATKQISSTVDSSVNLPTSIAVKSFVEGKGYLVKHPDIVKASDSSSTSNPGASGTFTTIDSVIRDTNGHITKVNTKTVAMPPAPSNVESATRLQDQRLIDGVNFDGTTNVNHYSICTTVANAVDKAVNIDNFSLVAGAKVIVKFAVTNTALSPTLNVNGTGSKSIFYKGTAIAASRIQANNTYEFVYNGTQFEIVGDINTDTTYSAGTGLALANNQFKHINAVTPSTASGDGNKTLTYGGSFTVPSVTYDAQGHITAKGSTLMTMPQAPTNINGNSGSTTKLAAKRNFSITGGAVAVAVPFDGTQDVALNVTTLDAMKLNVKSGDRLILRCSI